MKLQNRDRTRLSKADRPAAKARRAARHKREVRA